MIFLKSRGEGSDRIHSSSTHQKVSSSPLQKKSKRTKNPSSSPTTTHPNHTTRETRRIPRFLPRSHEILIKEDSKKKKLGMQDIFGSVRRSVVFRPGAGGEDDGVGSGVGVGGRVGGRLVEKIGTCLRKSRVGLGLGLGFLPKLPSPTPLQQMAPERDASPAIRWRKGELIGCGAFGHVYMGMNLDSGELLAVKQVLIGTNGASKERAQAHIRELEEEVKLLKNLSHANIVRYLGTAREDDTLNILLEFVPGGSISSLLGKFGSFPEAVIRMYSKQLLQGLEYLHQNGIMHRDIKGANILVDNKGCIKLADFGASKQVAKLATMTAAKSMKGTPYWMAPEVILQTGHSFSADIWSVGCTIIEMATGKPPWSQQFQEVAALFHIGTTKSHPPIPEHLAPEAKDFLLKCLQKEPSSRPTASDLLQHAFVTGEAQNIHPMYYASAVEPNANVLQMPKSCMKQPSMMKPCTKEIWKDIDDFGSESTNQLFSARPIWETCDSDDMCQLGDKDDSPLVRSSFNPISEPLDNWSCKFDSSPEQRLDGSGVVDGLVNEVASTSGKVENDFTFPCVPPCEEDEEVTETKIRAFLDEKALDLKKLQTPLYEFYNTLNASNSSVVIGDASEEIVTNNSKLPPRSKSSPSRGINGVSITAIDAPNATSPSNCSRRMSGNCGESTRILREIPSPMLNELGGIIEDSVKEQNSPSESFSERRRKWKEELDRELEREREMMRQAGVGGKTASPKERCMSQRRDRLRFASPAK